MNSLSLIQGQVARALLDIQAVVFTPHDPVTFKSGGKPVENSNKFIRIWQKQADGSWKLARIMWNPNNPFQPPPEEAR